MIAEMGERCRAMLGLGEHQYAAARITDPTMRKLIDDLAAAELDCPPTPAR